MRWGSLPLCCAHTGETDLQTHANPLGVSARARALLLAAVGIVFAFASVGRVLGARYAGTRRRSNVPARARGLSHAPIRRQALAIPGSIACKRIWKIKSFFVTARDRLQWTKVWHRMLKYTVGKDTKAESNLYVERVMTLRAYSTWRHAT